MVHLACMQTLPLPFSEIGLNVSLFRATFLEKNPRYKFKTRLLDKITIYFTCFLSHVLLLDDFVKFQD